MKFKVPKIKKKEVYLAVLIIVTGNFLGIGMMITERRESALKFLQRNKFGEGSYEETLKVHSDGMEQEIQIVVDEQKYTKKEKADCIEQACKELDLWIEGEIGEEKQLGHDLILPEALDNNPAVLFWSTSNSEVLDWNGNLGQTIDAEGEVVELTCTITLEEEEKVWKEEITVKPSNLSAREKLQKEIQTQAENLSAQDSEKLYLPVVVDGNQISYSKIPQNNGALVCVGAFVLGIGLFPLQKEREKQKSERRKKEMQQDYPEIVEKMVLFLRAGFSIRKTLEKLASGYNRNKEKYHMKERAAYEEVVKTCREMEGGVYEAEAYERWGKRCSISQYKMLSVLLVQNLRKGNQNILELLEREAAAAGEEQKRNARVRGEEASTKLLLPMVMQLLVVLIILMVPAFLSFM